MYVISYDISADKLRSKVAKTLEGFGRRIQYSVFECSLGKKDFERLYQKLLELIQDEEASVRIYQLCGNCMQKTKTIGQVIEKTQLVEEKIIVI